MWTLRRRPIALLVAIGAKDPTIDIATVDVEQQTLLTNHARCRQRRQQLVKGKRTVANEIAQLKRHTAI